MNFHLILNFGEKERTQLSIMAMNEDLVELTGTYGLYIISLSNFVYHRVLETVKRK